MKHYLFIVLLLLVSCSTTPTLQDKVKDAQKKEMKDPESYELLSLDKYKDITYGDELKARIEQQHSFRKSAERDLDYYTNSVPDETKSEDATNKLNRIDSIIEQLNNLMVQKNDSLDMIAATIYSHKFNGKNSLGVIVSTLNYVIVLPDESVKGFVESENDIPNNPNDFQEYFQIIK